MFEPVAFWLIAVLFAHRCVVFLYFFLVFLMPRNHHQHLDQGQQRCPLSYSSLSTRRFSYPTWILLKSSAVGVMPVLICRADIGNELTQVLLASHHVVPVPPLVNDIAEALQWLLSEAPIPLGYCYRDVLINLGFVCDVSLPHHIHPKDAHLQIAHVAMNNLLHNFSPPTIYEDAINLLVNFYQQRWNNRLQFVGFRQIVEQSYNLVSRSFGYGFLYFT